MPVVGPNAMRTLRPTKMYGGLPLAGALPGVHLIAARSVALVLYWLITSGQLSMAALICFTIGELGSPPVALVTDSGRPARLITSKIASAVAGSVRCGSGVMTGVGATVAGGADDGTLAEQAVSISATTPVARRRRRAD